jgi:hypothetical protein
VAEALTRRPSRDEIDLSIRAKKYADLLDIEIGHRRTNGKSLREIPFVRRNVISVSINGEYDIEAGLFEAER